MRNATAEALKQLMDTAGSQRELVLDSGNGKVRLDFKAENLELWRDTLQSVELAGNLLVACESNSGPLNSTRLSWIVGAAIRTSKIESASAASTLLQQLGASNAQADLVALQCPGLGEDLTWAFYLDRHGWLSGAPVTNQDELQRPTAP
ncbi:MAG: hypothetical protein VKJ31_07635 [Synechococcus sp.]|nr:hypothetical protein [Synechococcus sp.]